MQFGRSLLSCGTLHKECYSDTVHALPLGQLSIGLFLIWRHRLRLLRAQRSFCLSHLRAAMSVSNLTRNLSIITCHAFRRALQVKVKSDDGARAKSWRFDDLRGLLAHNPNMSVRFHAALARAMASKLVDTHNPAVKYRQLLQVRAVLCYYCCAIGLLVLFCVVYIAEVLVRVFPAFCVFWWVGYVPTILMMMMVVVACTCTWCAFGFVCYAISLRHSLFGDGIDWAGSPRRRRSHHRGEG